MTHRRRLWRVKHIRILAIDMRLYKQARPYDGEDAHRSRD
jgi:hypothetical protein